jgi:triosephosphate isomerase (TIM)
MRKVKVPTGPIVFGNWKMNGLRSQGLELARAVADCCRGEAGEIGVFPPFTILRDVAAALAGRPVTVGGQDCHARMSGAYTGSVSAAMLADAGASAVILGHSERRHGLGESSAEVCAKVATALAAGLRCIVCLGETEAEYLEGARDAVLASQIADSLPGDAPPERLVLAYEPVWAIGTGRTPTLAEIEATHMLIGTRLRDRWQGAAAIPILYGGSVKPENAATILAIDGVDGALVGGASLDPLAFVEIFRAGGGV